MKIKKIAILSPKLYPCNRGGLEIFNYYLINNILIEYNILILTMCKIKKIGENILFYDLLKRKIINDPISVLTNTFIGLLKYRDYDLYVVPYTSNSSLIYPFLIFYSLFKIQYIIIIHGGGIYPWKPFFLQKFFFDNANKIIAVSKPVKAEYEKRTGKKIQFIPPLIPFKREVSPNDNLRSIYGFTNNDKIIACIGSIKKIKGNEVLLKAFMGIKKDYIKKNCLKLLFIGDGPLKLQFEKIVKDEDLEEHIIFTGEIPHNKVKEVYKITDIYVIPSLFEGMPLSLLEAMFNELPIIGSDVKGINNIVCHGKNGLLFESGNSIELKKRIIYLIENPINADKFGFNALKDYRSRYNFDKIISKYNQIIMDIGRGLE